jgi:hypothetical protein
MDDITTKPDPHNPGDPHHSDDLNPHVAYEHGDADMFAISKYVVALVIGILIAAAAMWGLFDYFNRNVNTEEAVVPQSILDERPRLPPEPRLQNTPKLYIKDLRAVEDAQIKSYGWVDQKNGIVRIPIDAAIDAVAAKGLPSRPVKPDAGLDAEGYRAIPSVASSGRTLERIK